MSSTKIVAGEWIIEESAAFEKLVIEQGAVVKAPEGKALTMIVNGLVAEPVPGEYEGKVLLAVSDPFIMPPAGLFRFAGIYHPFRTALTVENGEVSAEKCIPELLSAAEVTNSGVSGLRVDGCSEDLNVVVVDGGEYVIDGLGMKLDGDGGNDFIGKGAGVTVVGKSNVTINNADFDLRGVTRCAIHVGGESSVTVNDSRIINMSPPTTKMRAAWMLGLDGTNRLTQLTDSGSVTYNRCDMRSNGWGVLSVDGSLQCRMYLNDCNIELTEPPARGYGAFSIGDCWVYMDNCDMNVNGYPILMNTENGGGAQINNCRVKGELYGAMLFRDESGVFNVIGSEIKTGLSTFLVKGGNSYINVKNSVIEPANGVILQLMDNDEPGMRNPCFHLPIGEVDTPIEGRDLAAADPKEDVFLKLEEMSAVGDIFNSTTDLKACCRKFAGDTGITIHTGALADVELNYRHEDHDSPNDEESEDVLQGVKNLEVSLVGANLTGVVSSAAEIRPEGLLTINADNHHELSNIKQEAAPTINNGVIVNVDAASTWTVTGTSYITALNIAEGGVVKAPDGKKPSITVDGAAAKLKAGSYVGKIVLSVE